MAMAEEPRASIGVALDVALEHFSTVSARHDERLLAVEHALMGFADRVAQLGTEAAAQMVQTSDLQLAVSLLQRR